MLTFSRKRNEGFWIEVAGAKPIRVVLHIIDRNKVKVSIAADVGTTKIYRDEVYARVLQERKEHQTPATETTQCPVLLTSPSVPSSPNA